MKDWLIKLGLDEAGPSAIRGAILGAFGYLVAHGSLLAKYGVISDPTTQTTVIHWQQLGPALTLLLPAVVAAVIKLFQVHGTTVVKSLQGDQNAPQ
jgi:hypothetical protein